MAQSKLDIWNFSLAQIGHTKRVVSPTEKTAERRRCEESYDFYRKALLTMAKWNFATVVETLTPTANTPTGWTYEYVYPSGCLKAIEIAKASAQLDPIPYKAGSVYDASTGAQRVIWTDEYQAKLVYVRNVTDTTMYTPLFEMTLAHLMGVPLARMIPKSTKLPTEMFQLAQFYFDEAVRAGEVEATDAELPEPEWITNR